MCQRREWHTLSSAAPDDHPHPTMRPAGERRLSHARGGIARGMAGRTAQGATVHYRKRVVLVGLWIQRARRSHAVPRWHHLRGMLSVEIAVANAAARCRSKT